MMTELKGLGAFSGKTHILPISIYYEDTDLSGMVYHANYLRYMERGRTEFFRMSGISRANLEDEEPTAWTLRRVALEFFRPARLDDQIAVHSVLTEVSGACMTTLTGKPRRLPKNVFETLAPLVVADET